jgi:type VI secretion system protein VasG
LETLRNRLALLKIEKEMLCRENHSEQEHTQRIKDIEHEMDEATSDAHTITNEWEQSVGIVHQIQELRNQLNQMSVDDLSTPQAKTAQGQIDRLEKTLQSNHPHHLIPHSVDRSAVAKVIAGWTGIPLETMISYEDGLTVDDLRARLQQRIIGQPDALDIIARHIVSYRAGLSDPNKPMGVFLLVGPSGVGKTETAQALAEILNGHERHLIRINMSEFQEAHTVATIKGAPPGYVGY